MALRNKIHQNLSVKFLYKPTQHVIPPILPKGGRRYTCSENFLQPKNVPFSESKIFASQAQFHSCPSVTDTTVRFCSRQPTTPRLQWWPHFVPEKQTNLPRKSVASERYSTRHFQHLHRRRRDLFPSPRGKYPERSCVHSFPLGIIFDGCRIDFQNVRKL